MKICSVNEMKNLDRRAIEEYGIVQEILMENAGLSSYFTILKEFGVKNKNFVIFCGVGNNGGDGLVVARKIHSNGGKVTVFILGDRSKFKGAAKQNFDIVDKLQIEMIDLQDVSSAMETVKSADAIIDAIFSTGLDRDVGGKYKNVINMINKSQKTVFSIDIPSGVNGNTGQIMGVSIKADYTITFGLPKLGSLLYPGYDKCGKLYVTYISFPPFLYESESINVEITTPIKIPEREQDTHKATYGKVLFIAGAENYFGAPYFSALSFLKAGGGLSYLACPKSLSSFIAEKGSEIVFQPQKETHSGSISIESKDELLKFTEGVKMVIIGPGLSLNEETQQLVRELVKEIKIPVLIDGDGITAISKDIEIIKKRKAETILTPHIGEMARITKMDVNEINKNKVDILEKTANELNSTIVLKGAHSLIGYHDKRIFINTTGNPGMATAGSGDILTGTIAAMFGLGLNLEEAVRIGVFIHGISGDLAAKEKGQDGITAQDILDSLPSSIKYYRNNFNKITENFSDTIHII